jgi:hypothetical protein
MLLDQELIRRLVAWGRPFVRGEIDAAALEEELRKSSLERCAFEHGSTRWPSAPDWLRWLRDRGAEPWVGPGVKLGFRDAGAAPVIEGYRSRLDRLPKREPAVWGMVFVSSGPFDTSSTEPTVTTATAELARTLEGLVALGGRTDMEGWTGVFARALDLLRSGAAIEREPLPPFASTEARALANATMYADVFGGMGSFNDFYLTDPVLERERSDLASALFDAVRSAVRAASNSV